jgi:hypothetical protein
LNHVWPGDQFSSHFHAVILAQPVRRPLIQVNVSRFISPHGKGHRLTWVKSSCPHSWKIGGVRTKEVL